jgi:hypothetical protein
LFSSEGNNIVPHRSFLFGSVLATVEAWNLKGCKLKVNVVFWWQLAGSVMDRCNSSVVAVVALDHVVLLYTAVYGT